MNSPTIAVALIAGVLSFLSPCIFPLIPSYVSHLTGSFVQDNKINVEKKLLLTRSISFILGFSVVFVVMGASASFIGQFFAGNREVVEKISGLLIIVFGLQMAGILSLRFLMVNKKWGNTGTSKKGNLRSFVLGLAFGSGWTPCVGLALSSILLLAGSTETMYSGMFLLFVYSIGLGIPFLLLSIMLTYSLGILKKINRWLPLLSVINGWILVVMGLLLFTGQLQKLSAYFAQFTVFTY
ncbi:cytochrome C biogenesis protein DsbD [Paenibacillus sp. FSL R5-0345]|uniref:cytochrome c biogenesis CcdA family protein n=1 Tax=Paenibacillus sp. FSL R5-0345 TaxID=1536770 RepID=UPI0004F72080|nr:cytochrome c biogenesis protein CcdA [Paenibacillus sp. FSL R5-0345]AIQ36016.1 cytochrome C biogenesis protein DsbD [Paenibacillus sp. FSL R5-0345]